MFVAVRHRAFGSSSVYFGPFVSITELRKWAQNNKLDVSIIELNPPETPIPQEVWGR